MRSSGGHRFFGGSVCCRAGADPARRSFLAGGAGALGVGAAVGAGVSRTVWAQATAAPAAGPAAAGAAKPRIDVHHHFIPPFHVEAIMRPGRRAGSPPPPWSPAASLEEMDRSAIAIAVLSV